MKAAMVGREQSRFVRKREAGIQALSSSQLKLYSAKRLAVDARLEAVDAGVIDAGGDGLEGMATGDFPKFAGREFTDPALEDF